MREYNALNVLGLALYAKLKDLELLAPNQPLHSKKLTIEL
jgi:hypothetical protein